MNVVSLATSAYACDAQAWKATRYFLSREQAQPESPGMYDAQIKRVVSCVSRNFELAAAWRRGHRVSFGTVNAMYLQYLDNEQRSS
jgi:hypothetical protein